VRYSLPTLDRAMDAVGAHQPVVSAIAMVHFAPFRYRAGSRTSILYTTLRE
jgi:hypothetical protein